jgi:hypothetical protein
MHIQHLLSELFILAACLYVFLRHIKPLPLANELLWESFVLSVAVAALFGMLRYTGQDWARPVSAVFQQLATITGAVGLVAGVYALVMDKLYSANTTFLVLAVGFILLLLQIGPKLDIVGQMVPVVAMAAILALAILAFGRKKTGLGMWLIMAVAFFASSQFSSQLFGQNEQSIDLFHYFTTAGILCLGIAIARNTAATAQV